MAHHNVIIRKDERGNLVPTMEPSSRDARTLTANPGDTIRWDSDEGNVRIKFERETPFGGDLEINGSQDHTVKDVDGKYRYECGVVVGGNQVRWPAKGSADSGGEVKIVRR